MIDRARRRQQSAHTRFAELGTGFDPAALALAGVTEHLDAADDALEQLLEDEVERPQAKRLPAQEVSRRSACPAHLYRRLYGE